MRLWFVLALFAASLVAAQPYPLEVLRNSGPIEKRINILILGDGYRACDQRQFSKEAKLASDALFAATPLKEYAAFFNVWAAHVVSKERGADNGDYGRNRETALGASIGCGGRLDRLVCVNQSRTLAVALTALPEYDFLVILVNETRYAEGSTGPTIQLTNSREFREVLVHEFGHALGRLADEYETPYPGRSACEGTCFEANVSTVGTADVKWAAWVEENTPLPTPEGTMQFADRIGAFEGGRYLTAGIFRPKESACRMRQGGEPFCSVCSEQLVKSTRNRLPFFEVFGPPPKKEVKACESVKFFVRPPQGLDANVTYAWRVNDAGIDAGGPSFETLVSGLLHVAVTGHDGSPLVRNDPSGIMSETVEWQIGIDGGACDSIGQCTMGVAIGPSCDDAGVCQVPTRQSCWPYDCQSSGIKCATQCDGGAECGAGARCENAVCIGEYDAGTPDAGISDAGQSVDGGIESILSMYLDTCPAEEPPPVTPPEVTPTDSCGCQATSASLLGVLLVLAWLRRQAR